MTEQVLKTCSAILLSCMEATMGWENRMGAGASALAKFQGAYVSRTGCIGSKNKKRPRTKRGGKGNKDRGK